ncbi:hypothetical protein SAMN05216596_102179 [Pseudomonas congelans]|uniref:Gas vesicle protein n=1 Tax=Pseudomonas congelans TaxID=200452 RepID=A0A1H0NAY3_9PSED|nr:hypothetical protein [Pseudomonas congelans]SDO89813.1 hypothetical protein SAMN05216596_102179 [Pseudomonas congelans]
MSDIEQDSSPSSSDDKFFDSPEVMRTQWEGRKTDWLLQWFVKFISDTSTSVGMTLTVGGSQISGNLISHELYFEKLATGFSEGFRKFEGVNVSEVKDLILSFNRPVASETEKKDQAFQYLHLSDVTVISGDRPINIQNGLWRGKIAAVEGFILGSSSTS